MSELQGLQALEWGVGALAVFLAFVAVAKLFWVSSWGSFPKAWLIWSALFVATMGVVGIGGEIVRHETDLFMEANAELIAEDKDAALKMIMAQFEETGDAKPHYWELLKRIDPQRYEQEQAELAKKRAEEKKKRVRERQQADIEKAQRFCRDNYAGGALARCLNESFLGLEHVKSQSKKRTDYP